MLESIVKQRMAYNSVSQMKARKGCMWLVGKWRRRYIGEECLCGMGFVLGWRRMCGEGEMLGEWLSGRGETRSILQRGVVSYKAEDGIANVGREWREECDYWSVVFRG